MANMPVQVGKPKKFNDLNFDELPLLAYFRVLLLNKKYEDAYKYLEDKGITFLHAEQPNEFQDRLQNVQKYMKSDEYKERFSGKLTAYKNKPDVKERTKNMILVGDE